MTFFYNLNKKLDEIRATPSTTHGQLNERDMSRAAKGHEKYGKEGMEALAKAGRDSKDLDPVRDKYNKYDDKKEVDEGLGDMARKVGGVVKKVAGKALDTLGHGSDEDLIRDMQKRAGMPQTGKKPMATSNEGVDKEAFAKLAPPTDKITFADKIAGAKKEVDEMLGDVAAEAMKRAIGGHGEEVDEAGYSAKAARAGKDIGKPGKNFAKIAKGAAERYGSKERGEKVAGAVLSKLRKGGVEEEASQGNAFTAHKRPKIEKPAVGSVTHGRKHDVEEIPGGRRVTRRVDPAGISVGADDEAAQSGEKRGRGRPKGPAKAPERVTGGATKHKGGRKIAKEDDNESDEIKQAMSMLKKAGYQVSKADDGAEQVDEKAVSKKQQKFMGMVHATQKGEKAPSKEVAKVAKEMPKKAATDFAATKHKGLPEKVKSKKEESVEETSDNESSKSTGGFTYGGGIYDSLNRDLENMIAENMSQLTESMNISMNISNDEHGGPRQSLTVTATDEDALMLGQLLKSAGLGGGESEGGCGCGSSPCSCGSNAEVVDENEPDYPTNTETSSDPFQYSGGLNKPKSTGQATAPVIASQDDRQESYASEEEDAIKRMMEMAGVKKKEVEEEKTDEGNKFTGNLAKARAAGKKEADLDGDGDMEKVDESIFDMTRNLWKSYKG